MKQKVRMKAEGEDRMSKLPDEVIHNIMQCLGETRLAVQTSILSNRWKLIWTTLPFLSFTWYGDRTSKRRKRFCKFIDHIFSHRNHRCNILKLKLNVENVLPKCHFIRYVKYAISHNAQELHIDIGYYCRLSIFRSNSLKEFKWMMDIDSIVKELDCWDLPSLTTLHLHNPEDMDWTLPKSCLICLPALRDLCLEWFMLPESLSLPALTTLRLVGCNLLYTLLDMPALISLALEDVDFPGNAEFFSALVSLQNLTLSYYFGPLQDCFISCPQLLNLKIRTITDTDTTHDGNILVFAPKLCNIDCVGFFSITCGNSALENVNIKLRGCFEPLEDLKRYYRRLTFMFPGLGSARILTLDLKTIGILSFLDTRSAIQTSVLSKRWKLIWTTLPFLKLDGYDDHFCGKQVFFAKFVDHVFKRRNPSFQILKMELYVNYGIPLSKIEQFIEYAISRNVQDLKVDLHYLSFSAFTSDSLKKLKLVINRGSLTDSKLGCWNLPALTTLEVVRFNSFVGFVFPASCLICLPSLRNLCIDGCNLDESSLTSVSLPGLTNLRLARFQLTQIPCNFPALLSVELDDILRCENINEFFSALVSVQNLTLCFHQEPVQYCMISCPRLVNLKIWVSLSATDAQTLSGEFMVSAPKLCNFDSLGIFPIKFGGPKLENVNIKLWDSKYNSLLPSRDLKEYYQRFTSMFSELGSAKILTLDLATIEALSLISEFLSSFPPPFYNLKYLKLPHGYRKSSLSSTMRWYLLGGSPSSTIFTTLPQNDVIPQTAPVSLIAQNTLLNNHFAAPTKRLVSSEDIHRKVCVHTVDWRVKVEHGVRTPVVDVDKVRQVGAPVTGEGSDRASSSEGNTDFELWQGHEVNSEFVGLLDMIMKKYPETFEHFTTKSKFCSAKLYLLCTSVNDFMKTAMTEIDIQMVTEYRALFADLQKYGFNLDWLVNRLNYIEELQFSNPLLHELRAVDCSIDDAKSA